VLLWDIRDGVAPDHILDDKFGAYQRLLKELAHEETWSAAPDLRNGRSSCRVRRCAIGLAQLLPSRGLQRGDLVAVHVPKGWRQIVALLGVLAAGCGYLPGRGEQRLLERIPAHPVPNRITVLDALPLTSRGKSGPCRTRQPADTDCGRWLRTGRRWVGTGPVPALTTGIGYRVNGPCSLMQLDL
jgi:hypothetical protein